MKIAPTARKRYTVFIITPNHSAWDVMSYGLYSLDSCKKVAESAESILDRGFTLDSDDEMVRDVCESMAECGIELSACHVEIRRLTKASADAPNGWEKVPYSHSENFQRN